MKEKILEVLNKYWGYITFREFQEEAIMSILESNDTLTILPTGGGKSVCFQVPALILDGTAVVISPLISLMKDQVDFLKDIGLEAECLNSALTVVKMREVTAKIRTGTVKLLYISPEKLMTEFMLNLLKSIKISYFVIDEAHCISHWGHDFRAEYRQLHMIKNKFSGINIHAFTATATEEVKKDILGQLRLDKPHVYVGRVDRPNLTYRLSERNGDGYKQIIDTLKLHNNQAGIIYCLKRTDVDEISQALNSEGFANQPYHAGLPDEERKKNQEMFASEKVNIITATIAFGMGIDRSNIRFIIHAAMPKSVEHYQQETGRAGRDGLPSYCYLFYSGADYRIWEYIFKKSMSGHNSHKKLGEMYNFCSVPMCRHSFLSGYFGQSYLKANCVSCDFCLNEISSIDESHEFAKNIIECVFGVEEHFGAEHISNVLIGNITDNIARWGHEAMPSFGLMSGETKRAVRSMIDQLIAQGYLKRTGEYLTLSVTDDGMKVLSGQIKPKLTRVIDRKKKAEIKRKQKDTLKSEYINVDKNLFETLRLLRRSIADRKNMPAYIVFSDKTLREMAEKKPKSLEDMSLIFGIGESKLKEYGSIFLKVIKEYNER
ncbi:MAG: DNA helicase RecQ [Candidatus Firestonebacteria bacterium]